MPKYQITYGRKDIETVETFYYVMVVVEADNLAAADAMVDEPDFVENTDDDSEFDEQEQEVLETTEKGAPMDGFTSVTEITDEKTEG